METILAGAISGTIYHLFAGQPLTIVGATGPLLVFETILFVFSRCVIECDCIYMCVAFLLVLGRRQVGGALTS